MASSPSVLESGVIVVRNETIMHRYRTDGGFDHDRRPNRTDEVFAPYGLSELGVCRSLSVSDIASSCQAALLLGPGRCFGMQPDEIAARSSKSSISSEVLPMVSSLE